MNQIIRPKLLPPEFQPSFRASNNRRFASLKPLPVFKPKAAFEKKLILEWIRTENPSSLEILKKVSNFTYTKYINMIINEFENAELLPASKELALLEKQTNEDITSNESRIEELRRELLKISRIVSQDQKNIKKYRHELKSINQEIERFQVLQTIHPQSSPLKIQPQEKEVQVFHPEVDPIISRGIYAEQQSLLDEIVLLEQRLRMAQLLQVDEFKIQAKLNKE